MGTNRLISQGDFVMRFVQCVTITTFLLALPTHFHTDMSAQEHDLHAAHMQVLFDILQSRSFIRGIKHV